MPILFVEWHRVVPVPRIRDSFDRVWWHRTSLEEGSDRVMGVPFRYSVEGLEIDCPSRVPVGLGSNHHQVTGVPISTRSMTPSLTSRSNPASTLGGSGRPQEWRPRPLGVAWGGRTSSGAVDVHRC